MLTTARRKAAHTETAVTPGLELLGSNLFGNIVSPEDVADSCSVTQTASYTSLRGDLRRRGHETNGYNFIVLCKFFVVVVKSPLEEFTHQTKLSHIRWYGN